MNLLYKMMPLLHLGDHHHDNELDYDHVSPSTLPQILYPAVGVIPVMSSSVAENLLYLCVMSRMHLMEIVT